MLDAAGNLYIADANNERVRKVSTSGIITTVAGGGTGGLGDGGPATQASLEPYGVAVDSTGNLYIADTDHSRVRKVTLDGIINTIAGTILPGFSGDGGPATSAEIALPRGVAVDSSGNIYISDTFNNRIRKVSTSGIITTFAGNGAGSYSGDGGTAISAGLDQPGNIALDAAGNLYIAATIDQRIRVVSNSVINTIAGNGAIGFSGDGGPALAAEFDNPYGVALESANGSTVVYVADYSNGYVRKLSVPARVPYTGGGPYGFIPVTPCRVLDTRNASGTFGGPEMAANATREFDVPNSSCGIPAAAAPTRLM